MQESILRKLAGWSCSSDMPEIYIHVGNKDVEQISEKSSGKDMPTAYFDTNVYIIDILQPNSNSRLILRDIKKGSIKVVLSDYLIDGSAGMV